MTPRIDLDVEIRRPVPEVFAAWATAEALARWFAPMAVAPLTVEMDFVVNGRYSIVMPLEGGVVFTTRGEFREIVPNKKIVMTWHCDAFADPASIVTVQFEPVAGGTQVKLAHERIQTRATRDNHRGGWQACLAELKRILHAK